jgi:hypothetical protein
VPTLGDEKTMRLWLRRSFMGLCGLQLIRYVS